MGDLPPDRATKTRNTETFDDRARYRAFTDLVRLPLGGGRELIYAPFTRTAHTLEADDLRILLGCRGFATLAEHAARFSPSSRKLLERLARLGLLVEEGKLQAVLAQSAVAIEADGSPEPRIATLAIPTCDRSASLREALESYLENARRYDRAVEFLVADDSADHPTRTANREAARALGRRFEVTISYAGLEEKNRYADALAAHTGLDRRLIAFAILNSENRPMGPGQNRNAILLHAAGDLLAMVDDDTRCHLSESPDRAGGLAVTSQGDPTEFWWPESMVYDESRDFLSIHEELLGSLPGACARRSGENVDVARASGMFFRRLAPSGGRVLTTQMGSTGDSGTGSMFHYLLLGGPSRSRLLRSEPAYRRAFESRVALRAARQNTIVDGSFCMSLCLGLDHRTVLPPFMPAPRNCDGVFGVMLRATRHDAYQGFLPWVVEHAPPASRSESFDSFFAKLDRVTCGDLVGTLVLGSRVESDARDPAVGLRSLGATFARWSALPAADFDEIVRINVLRARSADVANLENLLAATGGTPPFWARDAERCASLLKDSMERPNLAVPVDLAQAFGEDEARARFREVVGLCGELLGAWPDLVAAAKELRAQGVRLASPA